MRKKSFILILASASVLLNVNTRAQQPSIYEVTRLSINSSAFNDISPVIVNDGIVFCSDKRFSGVTDRTGFDGKRLFNIYIATRKDTSGFRKPKIIKSERTALFNNGPLCFAPDGKTVYFTSEIETGVSSRNRSFRNRSGIFIADFTGSELLSIRPFKYNDTQFDLGQPSISSDGKYLFFASDMPGGQGGSDIYFCESIDGEWSSPVNLGPKVNSPGIDNYPYMHPTGKLYFTSDRPGGLGGLDVYSTELVNGSWDNPEMLPTPINSSYDDFAFVAETDLQKGFFSSNRRRNDDIYEFTSTIIRKTTCDLVEENNYCYEFVEENAIKHDTLPFRYEWKFGDGNKGIGPRVEHCYSGPGTYVVQLDVVNLVTNEISYNEKSDVLEIKDIEQPYISGPDTANTGQEIKLSADSTNLPGWKISRYYWNFADETINIGKNVSKTFLKPGTYNIQLIVSTEPETGGIVREACVSKDITVIRKP